MGMKKALIFDLDGTLLDTITDIRLAINDALSSCGFDYSFSKKECHSLVGDGADALIHRALKENDNNENFLKLKNEYMPRYRSYQNNHTKTFNGITSTLKYLKNKGVLLFVCTNKPNALAHLILDKFFGEGFFTEIRGLNEGEAPKPDPHNVIKFMDRYDLNGDNTVFVGDSLPDLLTAQNASLPLALCTYGYGFYKPGLLKEAKYIIAKPKELAKFGMDL